MKSRTRNYRICRRVGNKMDLITEYFGLVCRGFNCLESDRFVGSMILAQSNQTQSSLS